MPISNAYARGELFWRIACGLLLGSLVWRSAASGAESPVDRFLVSIQSDMTIPASDRELIASTWRKCTDCDGEEFLATGLAVLSPKFRAVLDAYDADDYARCAVLAGELRSDSNPFVATHAAAYEIKSLTATEELPEAQARIDALLLDGGEAVARYSYFSAEMAFLRGYCLLSDLQYDVAQDSLAAFLSQHADAPQRLTIAAKQMFAELANRQPGRIGEIFDLMMYSQRRLTRGDSGQMVRGRQQKAVDLLDRLIKEAEEQEKSSGGSSGGSGRSGGQAPQSPQSPMPESQLPGGGPSAGSLRAARRANPADAWGAMPPAEREQILQALRESFPGRYRQLVEQYYEELAKKP